MTIDNVPCALCDERVYLDEPHCTLDVEYKASSHLDEQYVAHLECVEELNDPEP